MPGDMPVKGFALCNVIAAACAACHDDTWLQFGWDDRRILCSTNIDDIMHEPAWDDIEDAITTAQDQSSVAILHTHIPGVTVSATALDRLFRLAEEHHLRFFTFSELRADATPVAGLALSFDDSAVDAWYDIRETLAAHSARVTFFVTRFTNWTDEQHMKLEELAAAGHDVQAHSVNHLNAPDYVKEHGLAAYLSDEALPSIQVLEDAGFAVRAYAFPFGASNDELDDALLEHVDLVRVGVGSCPY